jgi:hypothetical protein
MCTVRSASLGKYAPTTLTKVDDNVTSLGREIKCQKNLDKKQISQNNYFTVVFQCQSINLSIYKSIYLYRSQMEY